MFMDEGEFEKISDQLQLFLSVCFQGVLVDNINSKNFPDIKRYVIIKSTGKFVIPLTKIKYTFSILFL